MREVPQKNERRRCQRFRISVPLVIASGEREISAYSSSLSNCGIYCKLPTADSLMIGREFDFLIILPPEITHSGNCRIRCHGQLVRKDVAEGHLAETGIAARITDYSVLSNEVAAVA